MEFLTVTGHFMVYRAGSWENYSFHLVLGSGSQLCEFAFSILVR